MRRALPKPLWEGRGVTLYHGDAIDLGPRFELPGMLCMDPPYSRHVHAKSRPGARKTPLASGNGKVGRAEISRAVDFGFEHLSDELRTSLATTAGRLSRRWSLIFCDVESIGDWIDALASNGLDYRRTVIWDKERSAPQFTGDQPAVAVEAIVCAHPPSGKGRERRRWNGGGRRGIYHVPIALNRWDHGRDVRINKTQKPEALIEALLRDFAEPGDLVYDLVAGGGTTGVVAMRLGLPCVLVELRADQAEATAARLEAEAERPQQLPLAGAAPAGKQEPLFR